MANRLADALQALGHQVWWDQHIKGGVRYAEEIGRALSQSEAVVVLWSPSSIASTWVLDEAEEGRDAGKLIPAMIYACKPPLGYRQYELVDLSGWKSGPLPKKLLDAITVSPGPSTRRKPLVEPRSSSSRVSICVLPFANMSGDLEQEYFSDGISEDITTHLSKVSALAVTARSIAFTFKGTAIDVRKVAKKLGVTHVLEGSVRKFDNRVRISAELIDGTTGDQVWAERYDRDLTDIFRIQDEISGAIVATLKLRLLPEEKRTIEQRQTESPEAYDLYLMARQYWLSGNFGDARRDERIVRLCTRAIETDPSYAQAWALMALAQDNLRVSTNDQSISTGWYAAERALELDPNIPEPHCVKARVFFEQGRHDDADAEINMALLLDADSWEVNKEAGRLCLLQRRIPEAITYCEKAVSLMEHDFQTWVLLATCYREQNNKEGLKRAGQMMIAQGERALKHDSTSGAALGMLASGYAILGQADLAKEWMNRALLVDPDNCILRYNLACTLADDPSQRDAAIELLSAALIKAGPIITRLAAVDPDLDPLRDDPRFKTLLASQGKGWS